MGTQQWDARPPLSLLSIPRTLGPPLIPTRLPAPLLCKCHLRLRVKGVKGWGPFPMQNTLGDSQEAYISDGPYRLPALCPHIPPYPQEGLAVSPQRGSLGRQFPSRDHPVQSGSQGRAPAPYL